MVDAMTVVVIYRSKIEGCNCIGTVKVKSERTLTVRDPIREFKRSEVKAGLSWFWL